MRFIHAKSPPAEKLLPLPVNTIALMSALLASVVKVLVSSAIISSSKALCLAGLFKLTVATPLLIVVSTSSLDIIWLDITVALHSEHTEARVFDVFV